MNSERYNIRPIDSEPEWFEGGISSKVAPFPVRKWKEPLPIGVEGRPVEGAKKNDARGKELTRFYPPLLILSTLLTAVFFFLYVTKPVVVAEAGKASGTEAAADEAPVIVPAPVDELIPWPGDDSPEGAATGESSSFVESSYFPEQLPSVSKDDSHERNAGEGIFIPFFEVSDSRVLTEDDEKKARVIQQELARKRLEAEALQLQTQDLQQQWQSLLDSAEQKQSTVQNEH